MKLFKRIMSDESQKLVSWLKLEPFTWRQLATLTSSRAITGLAIFLVLVPTVHKILNASEHCFTFTKPPFCLPFELPFSFTALYFAALFGLIATVAFKVWCPEFVRNASDQERLEQTGPDVLRWKVAFGFDDLFPQWESQCKFILHTLCSKMEYHQYDPVEFINECFAEYTKQHGTKISQIIDESLLRESLLRVADRRGFPVARARQREEPTMTGAEFISKRTQFYSHSSVLYFERARPWYRWLASVSILAALLLTGWVTLQTAIYMLTVTI